MFPLDDFPNIDLSVLTARQRLVIVLHYYDNWTYVEIAQAIGSADSTVRHHAKAARSRLKANLTR